MKFTCYSVIIGILFILFFSCESRRLDDNSLKVTKDGNGFLQSEIHYINDTVMHGLAKYYYYPNPKNVLKDEIEFNHGIKEGWYKHYRKAGTMESKTFFKNNIPDGENYWYYENGKIQSESFWSNNKQYGNTVLYYINGQMKHYYASDFFDNTLYVIKWDSLGNKIKEEGMVFSPKFLIAYNNDSPQSPILDNILKVDKEIIIKITVAQPPKTKTIIRMGELNNDRMVEMPIKNYTVNYRQTFTEIGKHTLVTVGEIKDLRGNLLKHDSILVKFNVIE